MGCIWLEALKVDLTIVRRFRGGVGVGWGESEGEQVGQLVKGIFM